MEFRVRGFRKGLPGVAASVCLNVALQSSQHKEGGKKAEVSGRTSKAFSE